MIDLRSSGKFRAALTSTASGGLRNRSGFVFTDLTWGRPSAHGCAIARRPWRAGRWGDVGGFLTEENDRFAAMARSRVAPGVFAAAFFAMPSRTRSTWRCAECALRSVGAFWASSFCEGSSERAGNGSA